MSAKDRRRGLFNRTMVPDEYDAAQERGEVAKNGQPTSSMKEWLVTVTDLGLSHKDIHEAPMAQAYSSRRSTADCLQKRLEPTLGILLSSYPLKAR